MARRIFIGDIQGCREELEQLLELLRFDPAADELQPVGDLVNRGPDSLGTLRLLKSLEAQGVLGNHDLHLLRAAKGQRALRKTDTFGDVLGSDEREPLLAWLAQRPFLRAWDDILMVHAGISPLWKDPVTLLEARNPLRPDAETDFVTRVRYCDREGTRPDFDDPPPPAPFRPWYDWPRQPALRERTLVFGHWAVRGLVIEKSLRGLDSGCVWGKSLSAWIAEEDRVVSVPARRAYASVGE